MTVHRIEEAWRAGEVPYRDGLYRPDDTGVELLFDGPGAYHPEAGQPLRWRVGGPLDVTRVLAEHGTGEVEVNDESPLPDGSGWLSVGDLGLGHTACLARLRPDRTLRWVVCSTLSNPFVRVRCEGRKAIVTNDWRNLLTLDLDALPFP
ncbi:hypothetical protein [Streptomyces sp. NPDC060184]|uniref:hypothetical protein n=1 Tax=Streptomyces sp. NPDC060184 TaxID=3347064 RepID=UPI003654D465